jgi:nucleoside 2-deoxyribosyltransferase
MVQGRVFIGGIMQGSIQKMGIHGQDYRARIADLVRQHYPGVEIVDPFEMHPNSVEYDREQAIETFRAMLDEAAAADVVIAYLPQASLGTAAEIWRAHEAGKPVYVLSPMVHNWMLWVTATRILEDWETFEAFIAQGGLAPHLKPTP